MTDTPEDVRALAEAWASARSECIAATIGSEGYRDKLDRLSNAEDALSRHVRATRPSPSASQEPRALLAFVEAIPLPGGAYRCGPLADVLCRLMRLSGHEADIVTGSANGIDHVWVEMGGDVYDPTARQFSEAPIYHPVERFTPELFSHPSASQGAEVEPVRILKTTLFQLERLKSGPDYYGGVLTDDGRYAWLEYSLQPQGYRPAAHPAPDTANRAVEDASYGWLYFNPDAGTEWAPDHPIESGEVHDAENVRAATLVELHAELISAWKDIAADRRAAREARKAEEGR